MTEKHITGDFECSAPELTTWLREKALRNQILGGTRTYVVCDEDNTVVAYYALAAGSVSHGIATRNVRRNMPDPIPVVILARLAVHTNYSRQGIGTGLLKDASLRSLQASRQVGVRAMLCHAIDEDAKAFYVKHGFVESHVDPLTLMRKLET